MSYQKDYYAILQVPRTASQEDIERAYKRLAALYDPKTSRKNRAAQRHADIQEAYSVLSSRAGRREHDKTLTRTVAAAGSMSPSDVISNRFILLSAGIIIASIGVILVAVLTLAGGGDDDDTASITPIATFTPAGPTDTPIPTPEGPTPTAAPATAPEVSGEPVTTDSGLQLIEIVPGTDAQPTTNDRVQIWYAGYLAADGSKFDANLDSGIPSVFEVTGVIPGFTEGLLTMKEGGTTRMIIPAAIAYGEQGSGAAVPPNADLIFDVTLIRVVPGPSSTPVPIDTATATPADSAAATTAAATSTP